MPAAGARPAVPPVATGALKTTVKQEEEGDRRTESPGSDQLVPDYGPPGTRPVRSPGGRTTTVYYYTASDF